MAEHEHAVFANDEPAESVEEYGPSGDEAPSPAAGEVPEADAAEQAAEVADGELPGLRHVPFDVDEADAAEQRRAVELGDDDYR